MSPDVSSVIELNKLTLPNFLYNLAMQVLFSNSSMNRCFFLIQLMWAQTASFKLKYLWATWSWQQADTAPRFKPLLTLQPHQQQADRFHPAKKKLPRTTTPPPIRFDVQWNHKGPLVQNRSRACHPNPQLTDRAMSHSKNTYLLKSTWCHVRRKTCIASPKNTSKTFQILHSVLAGPLLKDRWLVFPLLPPWNNAPSTKLSEHWSLSTQPKS